MRFSLTFLALLLATLSTSATSYTVKAAGGGNFTTIQACENNGALAAGDTCTVFAGTYNEFVSLTKAGTGSSGVCTNCITFTVNPGDTVQVYGFSVDANYNIVNGFFITDPALTHASSGIDIPNARTGIQITNNTITQVGTNPCIMTHGSGEVSFTKISGNTISWCGAVQGQSNPSAQTGIEMNGDHFLIQNNTITHTINGISGDPDHTVIRGNTYGPVNDAVDFPGCTVGGGCDSHVDYIEIGGPGTHGHILIESNNQNNGLGVGGAHAWLGDSADSYVISRFNTQYNVGSAYLANNGSSPNVSFWKDYNNTLLLNQAQQSGSNISSIWVNAANGSFLNNLMYNDTNPAGTQAAYYSVDTNSLVGFVSGHNLAWDTSCSPQTLANCTTGRFFSDAGNVYADPKLAATNGSSFLLLTGSPAIAAGTSLTTAVGSGSASTALTVADAGFFQDGLGLNAVGVQADTIRIGALITSPTAQISSINYGTNVITLASAITWANNDPVYLYKDSSGTIQLLAASPDIGAFQFANNPIIPPAPCPKCYLGGMK